jgi:hypothetical protein
MPSACNRLHGPRRHDDTPRPAPQWGHLFAASRRSTLPLGRSCMPLPPAGGRAVGERQPPRAASGGGEFEQAVRRGVGPAGRQVDSAPGFGRRARLPLVAKDTIKDALMSVLPVADVEASRQLGRAAVAAMFAVAAQCPCGTVIESTFHRSAAVAGLRRLPGPVVEVFCRVDARSPAGATRRERVPGMPGTSIQSAPPKSCGTTRSRCRWLVAGQCWRSTQQNRSTSSRSLAPSEA